MTETGRGVVYEPKILRSLAEICEAFGVGQERVRSWVQQGAPIAVEIDEKGTKSRYRAEKMRLYMWLEASGNSFAETID